MPPTKRANWLLLIHQIPAKPDYLRVKVGRELRQLGAVSIKSSVYVVPADPELSTALSRVARSILQQGGEAVVCEAQFLDGLADGAVEDLFRAASDSEYSAIASEARRLASAIRRGRATDDTHRRPAARKLERLRLRFDRVVSADRFGARGREGAARLLSLAEDRIQGVEVGSGKNAVPAEPPRGALWVTRTGVMVDRIASAWLIRRFVDPRAEFKFVPGRGYKPGPREVRFDMAGAEFTHEDGRCTFEVLVERFRLRDSALRPIAEIVHDLDLEDERHERPEAAGIGRLIVGLAMAEKNDAARLVQGGAIFENLYEWFRRRSR